jgi:NADPH:quinone reductase-like Zn-dependent oxidoreductase
MGSFGVQLAKNVFGAWKVIITLSTCKLSEIRALLGDATPDQIVDYTKENVVDAVGKGTVDFMYDNSGMTLSGLPLMKTGGVIVSVTSVPSGTITKEQRPVVGFVIVLLLNIVDWFYRTWTRRTEVDYSPLITIQTAADLEKLALWIDEGKIKPLIGRQAKLSDVEDVRQYLTQLYSCLLSRQCGLYAAHLGLAMRMGSELLYEAFQTQSGGPGLLDRLP